MIPPDLLDAATAPYRKGGLFTYHFARGKLSRDPVFAFLLQQGLIGENAEVVDIGCGQGLLASLLTAAAGAASGPREWPVAHPLKGYFGVDLMQADITRAAEALGHLSPRVHFARGDMCECAFPECDVVVILDVLHYVPIDAQNAVIDRVIAALRANGRLLLRIGDERGGLGFAVSQWVDRVVTRIRGHRVTPTFCRPLADWVLLLQGKGLNVQAIPMHQGTPFANILLRADKSWVNR